MGKVEKSERARLRCVRCGKFGAKMRRLVTLFENSPFRTDSYGAYGQIWFVDHSSPEGFVRGIPIGPPGAPHAEHANSTFRIATMVPLCDRCGGEEGTMVLLDGMVFTCDRCGRQRYGAGNDFTHICEDCLRAELREEDIDYYRGVDDCECMRKSPEP